MLRFVLAGKRGQPRKALEWEGEKREVGGLTIRGDKSDSLQKRTEGKENPNVFLSGICGPFQQSAQEDLCVCVCVGSSPCLTKVWLVSRRISQPSTIIRSIARFFLMFSVSLTSSCMILWRYIILALTVVIFVTYRKIN